jgi:hypothetical protein
MSPPRGNRDYPMTSNHKLTGLLQGRTITSTRNADGALTVGFDDGSIMTVQTAPENANQAATGGKIAKAQQSGTDLALVLENGTTYAIKMAEETSSVMVRDKGHKMEYAD